MSHHHWFAVTVIERRSCAEVLSIAERHVTHIHDFYGAEQGVRIARKHVKAYLQRIAVDALQISAFNELETPRDQTSFLRECADADARMRAA